VARIDLRSHSTYRLTYAWSSMHSCVEPPVSNGESVRRVLHVFATVFTESNNCASDQGA
jgi:hypothetical protein